MVAAIALLLSAGPGATQSPSYTLAWSETSSSLTRFTMTVPVSVSKLDLAVVTIAVQCAIVDLNGAPLGNVSPFTVLRGVDAGGGYSGTVTAHLNIVPGDSTVSPAAYAAITADQVMATKGVKGARCTVKGSSGSVATASAGGGTTGLFEFSTAPPPAEQHRKVLPSPPPVLEASGNF
jgi:hypothetical protein